jgi:lysophospholipid acyltransferase (LPLAT)-like uncharacterized protein
MAVLNKAKGKRIKAKPNPATFCLFPFPFQSKEALVKIRNRHLLRAAGWTAAQLAKGLLHSLRHEFRCLGPNVLPGQHDNPDRFIYATWHEHLLLPTVRHGHPNSAVLISGHADGQLLGSLIGAVGMGMVVGSSTRGGVEAVRQIVRPDFPWKHLSVTPDGPRGPRREVQPGVVFVASRTGMKIVPLAAGFHKPWRLKSWDRFAIPRPFSRGRCVFGEPIAVPPNLRSAALEEYRRQVQAAMDRTSEAAERWADTGRLTLPAGRDELRRAG